MEPCCQIKHCLDLSCGVSVYLTCNFILSSVRKSCCHDYCYLQLYSFCHVVRTISERFEIAVEMPLDVLSFSLEYVLYAT